MYPRAFAYHRAGSAAEAVDRLATHGDRARVLAGGMSLLPMMKYRQRAPEVLIDVGRLRELAGVVLSGRVLRIGATARHHELAAWRAGPALAMVPELARRIGDPQVRNMGTVGGGLAAVEPTSDWATALLACRGEVVARRAGGERRIAADDLFLDTHRSALAPEELLVEAFFSLPAGRVGTAHAKFEARAAAAAVMSAGVCLALDEGSRVVAAGVGVAGLGPVPARIPAAEAAVLGEVASPALGEAAAAAVRDTGGSFRASVAASLVREAVDRARARAESSGEGSVA